MKPSLAHVDEDEARRKEAERALEEAAAAEAAEANDEEPEAPELKPVMLKIRAKGPDRGEGRRMTHGYLKHLQDQEEWIKLQINDRDVRSVCCRRYV